MRLVEKYVFHSFFTAFALAWMVLSFVLTVGMLVKIAKLIVQGVSVHTIGLFMLIGFPGTLTLTLPLALLVSSLLVFSRLSSDSEIAAMRACGVNLLSVMKYPLLFALGCTLLGFYINNEIAPRAHEVQNNLKAHLSVDAGLELLEPGRMISEFEQVKLYFKKKEGNWIYGLLAYDFSQEGVVRELKADKALISTNGSDIVLDMYNAQIDPIDVNRPGRATMGRFQHTIPDALRRKQYNRKEKDLRFFEMRELIADLRRNTENLPEEFHAKQMSFCKTLFQKRFVEAFAALCFVLVGMPLGIKSHRKESTIGMGISLIVALAYYLSIMGVNELNKYPVIQPHLLIWLPVACCVVLAAILIPKNL